MISFSSNMSFLNTFSQDFAWLIPLFFAVLSNFVWARMIYLLPYPNFRKLILGIGLLQNLALFCYLSFNFVPPRSPLRFGFSVYILEACSCLLDVYRKDAAPSHKLVSLLYYLGFFPRYFAGPIFRYKFFISQSNAGLKAKWKQGTGLIFYGAVLELSFVRSFEIFTNFAFNNETPAFATAWLGAISNYCGLYFHFYALSLIAMGVGAFSGFQFPENFKSPFLATSITAFWDRWNVTLGDWLKNYFYLPIAMKYKDSKPVSALLLFVLMIFIGLWYGTEYKNLAMGLWFGVWICFEQVDRYHERIPPFLKGVFTFLIVCTGFVFLRSKDLVLAEKYFHSLFSLQKMDMDTMQIIQTYPIHFLLCIAGIVFCFSFEAKIRQKWIPKLTSTPT